MPLKKEVDTTVKCGSYDKFLLFLPLKKEVDTTSTLLFSYLF